MMISSLQQPPLAATLMGCVKGASDHFGRDLSVPMLFGLTGHAFLINIHDDLCPSSPYVWNKRRFRELLEVLGIATVTEYQVTRESTPTQRAEVEESLKAHIDLGALCMLDFLEHQLFKGYDGERFHLVQPWQGHALSEVRSITYGTWSECLDKEGWAHVTVLGKVPGGVDFPAAARDALVFGHELYTAPEPYQVEGYRMGDGAYENWIAAVERGQGSSHGHWWNGTVWSECRAQAATFLTELAAHVAAGPVAAMYGRVAECLTKAKDKNLGREEQLRLLREARETERAAADSLGALAAAL